MFEGLGEGKVGCTCAHAVPVLQLLQFLQGPLGPSAARRHLGRGGWRYVPRRQDMAYSGRLTASSASAAMDSDVALAEMELLEQNQKRLSNLTGRMTTILNGFDRRLVKLESSILPIHKSTQQLSHISANVEATRQELSRSLRHYGVVVDEEPLILRGPSLHDPWPYLEAIQRVARGIERTRASDQKNPEQVLSKMETLLELGARNVSELVREYTAAESGTVDVRSCLDRHAPLPSLSNECLTSVKALLQFLFTLRSDAEDNTTPFSAALASYAAVRSGYCMSCVAPLAEHVTSVANTVQDPSVHAPREALVEYQRGSAGLREWLQGLLGLVQQEQAITVALFEGMDWQHLEAHTFTQIMQPLVASVRTLLPTLLPRLEHGLNAHRLLVLDFVGASTAILGPDGRNWSDVMSKGIHLPLDLSSAVVQSRQTALHFFPEFLRDVKVIPVQREHDVLHVDVSDIARLGMRLLHGITAYQDVISSLLQTLGKKNWQDDEVGTQRVAVSEHEGLLVGYMADFLSVIVTSLERSVVAVPQQTVAAIFLLNNVSYLQQELAQLQGALPPAVCSAGEQLLRQVQRTARTSYLESWNSVVNALMDDGAAPSRTSPGGVFGALSGNDRGRDATGRFFEQLGEQERIHRSQPLLRSNPALTEALRDDVIR